MAYSRCGGVEELEKEMAQMKEEMIQNNNTTLVQALNEKKRNLSNNSE